MSGYYIVRNSDIAVEYDENGFFRYDTGVTRLLSPTLVAIKDASVVAMHAELVPSYDYENRALTEEEKEELQEEYRTVFRSLT